ncbi:MAG: flagellar biosynthetic protein FliQ [Candidatus Gastranaerophilales bacterium]|nr:flagellar biosynthetic protein FliQ [Candidatus Gastranaerophilales bacterium]
MELLLEHLGKGFINMLIIAMPCVLTAAGIGLVVGILQAVTQVQEQTIAAAPKIFGVFLVIMILGGTFTNILVKYMQESAGLAFNVITKQDNFVLPPEEVNFSKEFNIKETHYNKMKTPDSSNLPTSKLKNKAPITVPANNLYSPTDFMESQKINANE